MGQALCKRTLNIVEKLSDKVADKLRFYLSKADEAGRETDRQVSYSLTMYFPFNLHLDPSAVHAVTGSMSVENNVCWFMLVGSEWIRF
jgi:hypothetical protein